ncbi:MAG: hypothetical protein OEV85_13790 [Candidatus Thorarchaeota archaeon]|nr:hypothetical protein [Candidatus Thorarchaeota archaeon]
MEQIDTQTLYEMVKEWTVQPWDGIRYSHIVETLWDSIEACGLIEGPFGMAMTLLESYVVDCVEKVDAGLLDMNQAVVGLTTLLENDDFTQGAMTIEVFIDTNPVCRISNIDRLLQENWPRGPQKPQWWKRSVRSFWISMGAVSFVSMIIIYVIVIGLGILPPIQLVLAIAVGIPMYAMSYYFRKVATKRMWRAVFIMLGACGIGFWCLIVPLGFLFAPVIRSIPWLMGMPLLMILSVVIGAFIGDRIGKRRDYRPYM